ncbi:Protein spinster 3 [Aphanomyces cochlioides]|nr:Protein spinster 3 [Aphanomyces cochlioides]
MPLTLQAPVHIFAFLNFITTMQFLMGGILPAAPNEFQVSFKTLLLWNRPTRRLLGRMTTGMAEATFRVLTLPIIDQITPAPQRSFWMGLHYAGICVGSGVVYIYGSLTASNSLVPIFSGLGIGVVNFSVQAMVTFTPAIMIGLNVFDDAWAATIFGILTVVAGLVGAPLGGILLDRAVQGREDDALFRRRLACYQRLWFQLVVLVAGCFTIGFLRHSTSWLFVIFSLVFLGAIFATFGSTTISMLLSVTSEQRGLAMGLALLLQNLIGNVPGPVVFGAIKVRLAPGCGSVTGDNGVDHVSPECASESNQLGLRIMWTWMVLWMLLGFLSWAIALYYAKREEVNCATEIVPTPQAESDHVDYLLAVESQT